MTNSTNPTPDFIAAAEALIAYVEGSECRHESTRRGGSIWTVCNDCGAKWADDRGGFKRYKAPREIAALRVAISLNPPAPAAEAVSDPQFWIDPIELAEVQASDMTRLMLVSLEKAGRFNTRVESAAQPPQSGGAEGEPTDEQCIALATDNPGVGRDWMPVQRAAAVSRGRERYAAFLAAAPAQPLQAVQAPAEPGAIAEWRAARAATIAAVEDYNAALRVARAQDELNGFGFTNVNNEFQAMTAASNLAHKLMGPALDALYAATPVQAVQAAEPPTAEEARRELGKWLNEKPNRDVDRQALAALCAEADRLRAELDEAMRLVRDELDLRATQRDERDNLRSALAAAEPVASALIDNQGELFNFHSRVREFFGAVLDEDAYQHDTEDEVRADNAAPGRAPHRTALLYAAPPAADGAVSAALPAMRSYAEQTPRHQIGGVWQDPNGVHAWLEKHDRAGLDQKESK